MRIRLAKPYCSSFCAHLGIRLLALLFAGFLTFMSCVVSPLPVAEASVIKEKGMSVVYGGPCFRDYPPTDFLVSPDSSKAFVFTAGPVLCAVDTVSMNAEAVQLSWPLTVPRGDYQPMFTADGSRLFFSVTFASGTTGLESIDVRNLKVKEYQESASQVMVPSPDGKTLYFIRPKNASMGARGSESTLFAVDESDGHQLSETDIRVDGYKPTPISTYWKPLAVSHNARYLYACSSDGILVSIDIASGAGKVVTNVSGMSFSVSRDYRMMFAAGASGNDIKRIQLDTGTTQSANIGGITAVQYASDDGSLLQLGSGRPSLYDQGKSVFDMRAERFVPSLASEVTPLPDLAADYFSPDGKLKVTAATDSGSNGTPWDGLLHVYSAGMESQKPTSNRTLDFGRLPIRPDTPLMKFSPDGRFVFFLAESNDSNASSSDCGVESGDSFSCMSTPSGRDEGVFARASVDWLMGRDSSRRQPEGSSVLSWGIYVVVALLVALAAGVGALTVWYRRG